MRSFWIRVGLNPMTCVLVRTAQDTERRPTGTQGRRPYEDRGRVEWCCHKPRKTRSHQELEEVKKGSHLQPPEGTWPWPCLHFGSLNLISYFWPPEMWDNKFLLFPATKFEVIYYKSPWKLVQGERAVKNSSIQFYTFAEGLLCDFQPCVRH